MVDVTPGGPERPTTPKKKYRVKPWHAASSLALALLVIAGGLFLLALQFSGVDSPIALSLISRSGSFLELMLKLGIVNAFLWVLDKKLGLEWKDEVIPKLENGNVALALYLGLRFIGVCLLIAITG